jgi:polyisoprenoid-binding protein YceI
MKTHLKSLVFLSAMLATLALSAQEMYTTVPGESKVVIKGTSTLHDWQMDAKNFKSEMVLKEKSEKDMEISGVSFSCKSSDVTGEQKLMNSKAHEALKVKQFSDIKFSQSGVKMETVNGNSFKGNVVGKLEIAGVSRNVELPFAGEVKSGDNVSVSGSFRMKMSDYGIVPPSVMMGTIKTGDEITLEYSFMMQSEKALSAVK